jgi:hypothetical protein
VSLFSIRLLPILFLRGGTRLTLDIFFQRCKGHDGQSDGVILFGFILMGSDLAGCIYIYHGLALD